MDLLSTFNDSSQTDFFSCVESSNNQRIVKGLGAVQRDKRDSSRERDLRNHRGENFDLFDLGGLTGMGNMSNMGNMMLNNLDSSPNVRQTIQAEMQLFGKMRKNTANAAQLENDILELEKLCGGGDSFHGTLGGNNHPNISHQHPQQKGPKRGRALERTSSNNITAPIMEITEEDEGANFFDQQNTNMPVNNQNFNYLNQEGYSQTMNPTKVEKTRNNKKVTINEVVEEKSLSPQEFSSNFFLLQKQFLEKKDKLKSLINFTKLYEKLFTRFEEFKIKLPNILEKYLELYLSLLEEYNQIISLHDSSIDYVLEENEKKIEKIREKFKF